MKISYSEYIKKADVAVLVAETIFNELLKDSPILKIKNVAKTTSGGTPNRSRAEYYNGEIPWLKSGELKDGKINDSEEFITELGLQNSSAKLHPKGTLLVAMYGANAGKTGVLEFTASTNQAVCALYANEKVENDYLFWFFRSHRYQFIEKSKGGAQPNISQTVIKQTKIPVPDKEIQNQVTLVLNKINEKNQIEFDEIPERFQDSVFKVLNYKNTGFGISTELTHQLSLVKQLRQAFLREAMQGKLTNGWRASHPELAEGSHSATELLAKIKAEKEQLIKEGKLKKQKPLPKIAEEEVPFEIPENWVWCRLGKVLYDTEGGKSPQCKNEPVSGTNWGVIKTTAVQEMIFLENENKLLPSNFLVQENHKVCDGDILITRAGPKNRVGIVCCVENLSLNLILSDKTIRMSFNKKMLNPKFIAYSLNSPLIKPIIERKMTGMADSQVNISQENMKGFTIPLPPLSEQKRIVAKLDELMAYCDSLEESIKNSQTQNELLLGQVLREALEPASDKSTTGKPEEKEVVV